MSKYATTVSKYLDKASKLIFKAFRDELNHNPQNREGR